MAGNTHPKIAIVHDWLVTYTGSERVIEQMLKVFPEADLFSLIDILPEKERALVERLNIVKRHTRARGTQTPQGIVEKEAAIHISNLMIMCDKCNAPVRVGKRVLDDGRHVRVCRRCGDQLDR